MMKQVKFKLPLRMLALLCGIILSASAFAQQITVNGHVKDATGEPIIGATVRVVGQAAGAITDFDGNFVIKANQGDKITVSYIGYQEAVVNAASNVTVTLQDDTQTLENVVVIGYGRAKKNDLTGSVTAIKPDEMNHGLITSAQDALQGKVAGVNIVNNGGEPGGGATIRIRGGSSLNASNDPLIVIDGLAMDNYGLQGASNPLSLVNPNDIESFTVLKDASATAIYGSRASNGVIIITTKKGRKGAKPSISYNGNVSVSAVRNKMDVMNSSEFQSFVKDMVMKQKGISEQEYLESDYYTHLGYYDANGNHLFADTDWQDEIYRTAISTDHNITVSGGFKNMPYRVSLGYTDQNGVVKTSNYQRYTASINLSPTFFEDHLTVNLNAKGMYSKTTYANSGSAIGGALFMDPTKPVYDSNPNNGFGGYWQWGSTADWQDSAWTTNINTYATGNPVAALNNYSDKGKSKALIGNLELDYKVHGFEDLHLHLNAGMDISSGKSNKEQSPYTYGSGTYYYGNYGWNTQDSYNLSLNMYAQYMKDFNEAHHFDIMAGYEWQHFHKKNDYFYTGYYPSTSQKVDADGNPLAGKEYLPSEGTTLYKTENYLVSFFGRLNYSLLDRYLITATLRADGSSHFNWITSNGGENQQWGLFPSVALAWKINNEAFLKNAEWLSDLKLRAGWGITGQQEGIGDYTYIPTYTPNKQGAYYPLFNSDGRTYRPDAYNNALTWEKTTTWNAGLDFGILNDRLTLNFDFYHRKTKDLINTVVIPVGTNFSNKVTSNIGSLHNTGIEVAATWRAVQTKDWNWQIGYNFTWNKNEIDELVASSGDDYKILHGGLAIGDSGSDGIKSWHVGNAVEAFYTYQQVYDVNGQPIDGQYVDRNADGIINQDDRYYYKKSTPDVTMGFTSKLMYKKWDFGFSLRASFNNYVYNGVEAGNSNLSLTQLFIGNAWHNVLDITRPKNWQTANIQGALSDYYIQNASFLKCDNITLGYSFDSLFGLKASGRVYATAQNVFTITDYKGLDPEINGGYDGNIYPRPFVGIIGVNLNF
ncbi:MAG: TonB-dependent receptor [Prevotella sp.]|nr:TonB-dependent receptor [Prevotella sp.]